MEAAAEAALANGTGDQEREFYEVGASVHHAVPVSTMQCARLLAKPFQT
jgi:hypothetical protein